MSTPGERIAAGDPYGEFSSSQRDTREDIIETCDELKALLLSKNKSYGDSALDPVRIFSQANPEEQLRVRLDDKLARVKRVGFDALGEDTHLDLLGYLVLLLIARRRGGHHVVEHVCDRPVADLGPHEHCRTRR